MPPVAARRWFGIAAAVLSAAAALAPLAVQAQAEIPSRPSQVVATAGNTSADVSFVPSTDAYDSLAFGVARFRVTAIEAPGGSLLGAGASAPSLLVASSPAFFEDLPNGAKVRFTVTALNGRGQGTGSAGDTVWSSAVVVGAPRTPTALMAFARNESIFLSWLAPEANAAPITSYNVTTSPPHVPPIIVPVASGAGTAAGANHSVLVSGLTNYVGYSFSITATNAVGDSTPLLSEVPTHPQEHTNNLVVASGQTHDLSAAVTQLGTVVVQAGGVLRFASAGQRLEVGVLDVSGTVTATSGAAGAVDIVAYEATVRAGGAVHADGIVASVQADCASTLDGAGHGSTGALGTRGAGTVYGSAVQPTQPGGVCHSTNKAGGTVRLQVATVLTVDGRISADAVTSNDAYGGASGGSVWITCAELSGAGSGVIRAAGGRGRLTDAARAAGAGGRVSVTALVRSDFRGTAAADGGDHSVLTPRPGTVYLDLPGQVSTTNLTVPAGASFLHLYMVDAAVPDADAHFRTLAVGAGGTVSFVGGSDLRADVLILAANAVLGMPAGPGTDGVLEAGATTLTVSPPLASEAGALVVPATATVTAEAHAVLRVRVGGGGGGAGPAGVGSLVVRGTIDLRGTGAVDVAGDLTVTAGGVIKATSALDISVGGSLLATGSGSALKATTLTSSVLTVNATGGSTVADSATASAARVYWHGASLHVQASSSVHADGMSADTTGTPPNNVDGCYYAGCLPGASHGGQGTNLHKPTYGSATQPTTLGSVGPWNSANKGGGALRIDVGALTIDASGSLSSIGTVDHDWFGGGSGGSIWVTSASLSGAGTIAADGCVQGSRGANGAGGRVAVYVSQTGTAASFTGTIRALQGAGGTSANDGTVYLDIVGVVQIAHGIITIPPSMYVRPLVAPANEAPALMGTVVVGAGATLGWDPLGRSLAAVAVNVSAGATLHFGQGSAAQAMALTVHQGLNLLGSGATVVTHDIDVDVTVGSAWPPGLDVPFGSITVSAGALRLSAEALRLGAAVTLTASAGLTANVGVVEVAEDAVLGVTDMTTGALTVNATRSTLIQGRAYGAIVSWHTPTLNVTGRDAAVDANSRSLNSVGTPPQIDGCYYAACAPSASHGGVGHGNERHLQPPAYGDPVHPVTLGSAGVWKTTNPGGGAIRIVASEWIYVSDLAFITANALLGHTYFGGGSGGSVWIDTPALSGQGTIAADGCPLPSRGWPGAGGRVAIYLDPGAGVSDAVASGAFTFTGKISADSPEPGVNYRDGTVYLEIPGVVSMAGGVIAVPDGLSMGPLYIPPGSASVFDRVTVGTGGRVSMQAPTLVTKTLNLSASAKFEVGAIWEPSEATYQLTVQEALHLGSGASLAALDSRSLNARFDTVDVVVDDSSIAVGGALTLTASSLTVAGTGSVTAATATHLWIDGGIDVVDNGGVVKTTASNTGTMFINATGPCTVAGVVSAANLEWHAPSLHLDHVYAAVHSDSFHTAGPGNPSPSSGCDHTACSPSAAHAGKGGGYDLQEPYGSALWPVTAGSRGAGTRGSLGGGVMHLVLGTLSMITGARVSANAGTTVWFGGGSGGSVIAEVDVLSGDGTISADGTGPATRGAWGGGGGRVLVRVSSDSSAFTGSITASGGPSDNANAGVAGAGTLIVAHGATIASARGGSSGTLSVLNAHPSKPATYTWYSDVMSGTTAFDNVTMADAFLVVGTGAYLRTVGLSEYGQGSVLRVDQSHGLVITGDICNATSPALPSDIDLQGQAPVAVRLDDGAATSGSFLRGTSVTGVFVDGGWASLSGARCRFGDHLSSVAATMTPAASCPGAPAGMTAYTFRCDVPPDPRDRGSVEVSFSPDGVRYHSFNPPHTFRFIPDAACNLYGDPSFPAGCTAGMLGDGTCDAACDTRACAHDNRDCEAAPVVMGVGGNDTAAGTRAEPVATLDAAMRLACSGFSVCLPILVLPGSYPCSATSTYALEKNVSIAADDLSNPPVFEACPGSETGSGGANAVTLAATAAVRGGGTAAAGQAVNGTVVMPPGGVHIAVNASVLNLTGIDLRVAVSAVTGSDVIVDRCSFGRGGAFTVLDSFARISSSVLTGGAYAAVRHSASRRSAWEAARLSYGLACPSCSPPGDGSILIAWDGLVVDLSPGSVSTAAYAPNGTFATIASASVSAAGSFDKVLVARGTSGGATATGVQVQNWDLTGAVDVTRGTLELVECVLKQPSTVTVRSSTEPLVNSDMTAKVVASGVIAATSTGTTTLHTRLSALQAGTAAPSGVMRVKTSAVELTNALLGPEQLPAPGSAAVESSAALAAVRSSTGSAALVIADCRFVGRSVMQGITLAATWSTLVVRRTTFTGMLSTSGAALWATRAAVELYETTWTSNVADLEMGGAIHAESGGASASVLVVNATFAGNIASGGGGGALSLAGPAMTATVGNSSFVLNEGFGGGGGLRLTDGVTARVHDTRLESNVDSFGGGLYVVRSAATVDNCTIEGNIAFSGANVHVRKSTVRIEDSVIGSSSGYVAAGIRAFDSAHVTVVRSSIRDCTASTPGGAIALTQRSTATLVDSTITGNSATLGGAALASGASTIVLTRCSVHSNSGDDAVLAVEGGSTLRFAASSVVGNGVTALAVGGTVPSRPGGVYCTGGSVLATDTTSQLGSNTPYNIGCTGCNVTGATLTSSADALSASVLLAAVQCDRVQAQGVDALSIEPSIHPTVGGNATVAVGGDWKSATGAPVVVYVAGSRVNASEASGVGAVTEAGLLTTNGTVRVSVPAGRGVSHVVQAFVEGQLASTSTAGSIPSVAVSYLAPTVSSLTPRFLDSAGGWLTVRGGDFGPPGEPDEAGSVSVNGAPCTGIQRDSHEQLRCLVGSGVGVSLPVVVVVGGQTQRSALLSIGQASLPAAPTFTAVSVVAPPSGTGPTSLSVSLKAPDSGGVPVASFEVWHQATSCAQVDLSTHPTAGLVGNMTTANSDVAIGGLLQGCRYSLWAAVTNQAEMSGPSANASADAAGGTLLAVAPQPPVLTRTQRGSAWPRELEIVLQEPFDGGVPITSYVVSYSPSASFAVDERVVRVPVGNATVNGTEVTLPLGDLTAYTVYHVRVAASNGAGDSAYGVPLASTALLGLPSAPRQVNASFSLDFARVTAVVRFLAPLDNGGRALETYRVVATPVSGNSRRLDEGRITPRGEVDGADADLEVLGVAPGFGEAAATTRRLAGGSTTLTFVSLTAVPTGSVIGGEAVMSVETGSLAIGETYTFAVAASNAFAPSTYGASSAPSRAAIMAGPPPAPALDADTGVWIDSFNDTHARLGLRWASVDWHGSAVQAYEVRAWRDGSPETTWSRAVAVAAGANATAATVLDAQLDMPLFASQGASRYARAVKVALVATNGIGSSEQGQWVRAELPCRTGFGTELNDRTFCSRCAPGSWVPEGQSNGIAGAACVACGQGHFSGSPGATSCTPCAIGTYQPLPGQDECKDAPTGTVTPSSGAHTVVACDVGSAPAGNKSVCLRCEPGWVSNGAPSAGCVRCPAGEYAPPADQGFCVRCAAGTANGLPGQTACQPCATGNVSTAEGALQCTPCQVGTIAVGGVRCDNCPAGSFASVAGSTACTLCPVGSTQPRQGQSSCVPVQLGEVTPAEGSVVASQCAPGTVPSANRTACELCPAGSASADSTQPCAVCPPGTRSTALRTECLPCAAGEFSGAAGAKECQPCPPGQYSDAEGLTVCTQCLQGTYQPNFAAKSSGECLDCPSGMTTNFQGATAISNCVAASGQLVALNAQGAPSAVPCPPVGADCSGTGTSVETLVVQPGFWRVSNATTTVRDCRVRDWCTGGAMTAGQAASLCREGHEGPYCEACRSDWYMTGDGCVPCSEIDARSIASTVFALLVMVVIISNVVDRFRRIRAKKKAERARVRKVKRAATARAIHGGDGDGAAGDGRNGGEPQAARRWAAADAHAATSGASDGERKTSGTADSWDGNGRKGSASSGHSTPITVTVPRSPRLDHHGASVSPSQAPAGGRGSKKKKQQQKSPKQPGAASRLGLLSAPLSAMSAMFSLHLHSGHSLHDEAHSDGSRSKGSAHSDSGSVKDAGSGTSSGAGGGSGIGIGEDETKPAAGNGASGADERVVIGGADPSPRATGGSKHDGAQRSPKSAHTVGGAGRAHGTQSAATPAVLAGSGVIEVHSSEEELGGSSDSDSESSGAEWNAMGDLSAVAAAAAPHRGLAGLPDRTGRPQSTMAPSTDSLDPLESRRASAHVFAAATVQPARKPAAAASSPLPVVARARETSGESLDSQNSDGSLALTGLTMKTGRGSLRSARVKKTNQSHGRTFRKHLGRIVLRTDVYTKVKLVVTFIQLVSSSQTTLTVAWPPVFTQYMSFFSFLNVDFLALINVGCLGRDYYTDLAVMVVVPAVLCLGLSLYGAFWCPKHLRHHVTLAQLVIVFVVFAPINAKIFGAVPCETFEDGSSFLKADLSIDCHAPERGFWLAFTVAAIMLWPVGVPTMYFIVLWRHRDRINPRGPVKGVYPSEPHYRYVVLNERWHDPVLRPFRGIFSSYNPRWWWFECVLTLSRSAQAGFVVFVAPGTASQIVYSILVAAGTLFLVAQVQPFVHPADGKVAVFAQMQLMLTLVAALVIKTGVSAQGGYDAAMGWLLVVINVLVVTTGVFAMSAQRWTKVRDAWPDVPVLSRHFLAVLVPGNRIKVPKNCACPYCVQQKLSASALDVGVGSAAAAAAAAAGKELDLGGTGFTTISEGDEANGDLTARGGASAGAGSAAGGGAPKSGSRVASTATASVSAAAVAAAAGKGPLSSLVVSDRSLDTAGALAATGTGALPAGLPSGIASPARPPSAGAETQAMREHEASLELARVAGMHMTDGGSAVDHGATDRSALEGRRLAARGHGDAHAASTGQLLDTILGDLGHSPRAGSDRAAPAAPQHVPAVPASAPSLFGLALHEPGDGDDDDDDGSGGGSRDDPAPPGFGAGGAAMSVSEARAFVGGGAEGRRGSDIETRRPSATGQPRRGSASRPVLAPLAPLRRSPKLPEADSK